MEFSEDQKYFRKRFLALINVSFLEHKVSDWRKSFLKKQKKGKHMGQAFLYRFFLKAVDSELK